MKMLQNVTATRFCLAVLAVLAGMAAMPHRTAAQPAAQSPFRIDTDIYLDQTKPPVKRTLTLFFEGTFYDFEEAESGMVTVIDPARNRIVLLNRQRQIKTTLPLQNVQSTVAQARVQADAKITAVIESGYQTEADGRSIAVVKNDFFEYRAVTQPTPHPDIAEQYAAFADWSARLNAIFPPKLPPYLRMDLNRLLADHQAIPSEIQRRTRQGGREMLITCRLIPVWRLSHDDQARIARCGSMLAEFREVQESEYWQASPVVQATAELPAKPTAPPLGR